MIRVLVSQDAFEDLNEGFSLLRSATVRPWGLLRRLFAAVDLRRDPAWILAKLQR